MKKFSLFFLSAVVFLWSNEVLGQTLSAFPGAEGAGMNTTGGRGGNVYFVNSLADTQTGNSTTHEGTLRWCLSQAEPRIIMFKVAGIIEITSRLKILSNTTIVGETAPGDGICIKDKAITVPSSCLTAVTTISCPSVTIDGDNIIIRYIRIRPGDDIDNSVDAPLENIKFETDCIFGRRHSNIIIDHCSFSWGIDESASFYDNSNFTMQWCIVAESLRESFHPKGTHGYGGIWGGKSASFHHNLLAHHDSRNPRMCGSRYSNLPDEELVDFRNNVIYNWGSNSGYAGEGGSYDFVNNYYKYSSASSNKNRIFAPNGDDGSNSQPADVWGTFYVDGNYVNGYPTTISDNWDGIDPKPSTKAVSEIKSNTEFTVSSVSTQTAEEAFVSVLAEVGASKVRDAVDKRITNEVENGLAPVRGSKGTSKGGLIDSPSDVGGYPTYTYNVSEVLTDSDYDGMPDEWETANGLDPNDASDRNNIGSSGYTRLEEYIYRLDLNTPVEEVMANEEKFAVYPNPATDLATLKFNMIKSGEAKIDLFNLNGQLELTIAKEQFLGGKNEVRFNTDKIKSGVYLCKMTQDNSSSAIKMVVK